MGGLQMFNALECKNCHFGVLNQKLEAGVFKFNKTAQKTDNIFKSSRSAFRLQKVFQEKILNGLLYS